MDEEFYYVVARPWSKDNPDLCIYSYHGQVQHGTMKSATEFLKYVKGLGEKHYAIYRVDFTKV